jgi:hypothetical protein
MAAALRYVDGSGDSKRTCSLYLKTSIDSLFAKYEMSYNQVIRQGYDGASNIQGHFNGVKSLIMRESSTSY